MKYPTISYTYPAAVGLKDKLEVDPEEPGSIQAMKVAIKNYIETNFFQDQWHMTVPVFASVFDPRFKSLKFLDISLRPAVYNAIREEITCYVTQTFSPTSDNIGGCRNCRESVTIGISFPI